MKLNIGCGLDVRDGWVNVDCESGPGVDLVLDLDDEPALPFPDDSVTEVYASHVIEHLRHPLPLMAELWRVAAPGCVATFRCPYGSTDTADEDPTHVRRMFLGSWEFFGQPAYWRTHSAYGYVGDWCTERVEMHLYPLTADLPDEDIPHAVRFGRNAVSEMVATLVATKPARPRDRALANDPRVVYLRPKKG